VNDVKGSYTRTENRRPRKQEIWPWSRAEIPTTLPWLIKYKTNISLAGTCVQRLHLNFVISRQPTPRIDCIRNVACIGSIKSISIKAHSLPRSPQQRDRKRSQQHHRSPIIVVQVEFLGATSRPEGRMRNKPTQPRTGLRIWRQFECAVMLQDVVRAEQPYYFSPTLIQTVYRKKRKGMTQVTHMALPSRPSSSAPIFVPQTRSGAPFRDDFALEERC
jgi:hypothetical protein